MSKLTTDAIVKAATQTADCAARLGRPPTWTGDLPELTWETAEATLGAELGPCCRAYFLDVFKRVYSARMWVLAGNSLSDFQLSRERNGALQTRCDRLVKLALAETWGWDDDSARRLVVHEWLAATGVSWGPGYTRLRDADPAQIGEIGAWVAADCPSDRVPLLAAEWRALADARVL